MVLKKSAASNALVACQRFGLGPKRGTLERIGRDPLAALKRELDHPQWARISKRGLPSYKKAAYLSQESFEAAYRIMEAELRARVQKQFHCEIGFLERLVLFWSNHFSMSVAKTEAVRGTIGQMERDVIRKHLLGNFSDMLKGVIKHPAMIAYLDNQDSIGPNSKIGQAWGVGLNENLAREILELHTVGSGGGYDEADVTNFARILTGWSYVRGWEAEYHYNGGRKSNRGQFIFRQDWHEPGDIKVMDKTFEAGGVDQGLAVLDYLATHEMTAEHIAFKLVLHFITDKPTPEMVAPVAKAFLDSGGDLKKTTLALISLPEALEAPMTKLRTPYESAIGQYRALGRMHAKDQDWLFWEPLRALNNAPWERGTPDGYPDESFYWLNPDGMRVRSDIAFMIGWLLAGMRGRKADAMALSLFGPAVSSATLEQLRAAQNRPEALTILFMSPEMLRR